ncbi:MAG: TspO/MBR family protein [Pyrinomonadaceae bacterium]
MTSEPNTLDRMRSILVLVATIATITFNGLAAAGYVNGVTPEVISDAYPTVITPAGYAFTIWSVIYLGILAFSIYQLLPANLTRFRPFRSLYILSSVLNCAWIYFWHREQVGVCLLLIFSLLVTLILMLVRFRRPGAEGGPLFTKSVFGVYAGWVTAATLVSFAVFLKYLGVEMPAVGWNTLGVASIILAAALAVIVRLKLQNYFYPLAIAWAATAIAVKQSGNTAIVVASSVCVIVCLVMAVSFVLDQKSTTT